jgi:hypothetical protein
MSPARCEGGSRWRTTAAGCVATHRRELKLLLTRQRRCKNGDLTNKRRDYKWLKSWAVDSHTDPEVSTLSILPEHPQYTTRGQHSAPLRPTEPHSALIQNLTKTTYTPHSPSGASLHTTSLPVEIGDGAGKFLQLVAAEGQHLQVDQGVQVGGQCGDPILPVYTAFSVLFQRSILIHAKTGMMRDGMVVTESKCIDPKSNATIRSSGTGLHRIRGEMYHTTLEHTVAYLIHRVFSSDNSNSPLGNSVSSLLSIAWDVQHTTHCEINWCAIPFAHCSHRITTAQQQ